MPRVTVHHLKAGKTEAVVTVRSPDLTPEEYRKAIERVEEAAREFMADMIQRGYVDINSLPRADD